MAKRQTEDEKLKNLLKRAIIELIEERKDLLQDVFQEAMEEIALRRAIKEGKATRNVTRSDVFSILEGSR